MAKFIVDSGLSLTVAVGMIFILSGCDSDTAKKPTILSSLEARKADEKLVTTARQEAIDQGMPVASATGPWPKAVARDTTFSFGKMQVKEMKSHQFVIKNEGEADLQLKAGKTTCKCTKFGFGEGDTTETTTVVKPGESVVLTMSWKAGEVPDREFRHGGDVHTNDPERLAINYAVEGAIEMPFELLPQPWSVGNVYENQPGKMMATIGSKVFDTLDIVSIECPSEFVKVTPEPLSIEGRAKDEFKSGYALTIEVSDAIPAGLFTDEVTIKVAQLPEPIRVGISARKQGVLRLQQMAGTLLDTDEMQIQMGSFPATEGREAKLLLIVDEKDMSEHFQLTDIKADPSFVNAKLTPIGEASGTVHRYLLTIAIPPGRPHVQRVATKPGFIKMTTNHPSGESLHFSLLLYSN